MTAAKKHESHSMDDVMTAERLRAHWYGENRVPFWNYDPALLTMGVEIEYFIAHVHGDDFTLATKDEYLAVIDCLVRDFGYKDFGLKDQPGRVSKETDRGFIAIKPDFAWHILEIALPPRHSLEDIKELLETTLFEVDQALAKFGLERLDLSCLPDVPDKMDLVELDRLRGYSTASKSASQKYGDVMAFPALITATHVHLNCSDEKILSLMPMLYINDEKNRNKYVRIQTFRGIETRNFRTDFYENGLGLDYGLRTIPNKIPRSVDDYVALFNRSEKLFPNDNFFHVRDMSYIRPTRHGTLEFRSACSFHSAEDVLNVVSLRKQQLLMSLVGLDHLNSGNLKNE